jgi:hypothetical protein
MNKKNITDDNFYTNTSFRRWLVRDIIAPSYFIIITFLNHQSINVVYHNGKTKDKFTFFNAWGVVRLVPSVLSPEIGHSTNRGW